MRTQHNIGFSPTNLSFKFFVGSYDATPSDYVSMIITDYGMVNHVLISVLYFIFECYCLLVSKNDSPSFELQLWEERGCEERD